MPTKRGKPRKERPMQFKAGDYVVHPTYGVGSVLRLEEKQLAEAATRLYYVIDVEKSTVWVPVDAHGATELRKVTPSHDLEQYRRLLKGKPTQLEKDHHRRRLFIAERMKNGTFSVMCEVVRDLTAHGWAKPLSDVDATSLQKIRAGLFREWAAAAGISIDQAKNEIDALLLAGRRTYHA